MYILLAKLVWIGAEVASRNFKDAVPARDSAHTILNPAQYV